MIMKTKNKEKNCLFLTRRTRQLCHHQVRRGSRKKKRHFLEFPNTLQNSNTAVGEGYSTFVSASVTMDAAKSISGAQGIYVSYFFPPQKTAMETPR